MSKWNGVERGTEARKGGRERDAGAETASCASFSCRGIMRTWCTNGLLFYNMDALQSSPLVPDNVLRFRFAALPAECLILVHRHPSEGPTNGGVCAVTKGKPL